MATMVYDVGERPRELRVQVSKAGTLSLDLDFFPKGLEFGNPNHLSEKTYVGAREIRSKTCNCAFHPYPSPHWHACAPHHRDLLVAMFGVDA